MLGPGPTRTTGLADLAGQDTAQQQGLLDYLATQVAIGRLGEPDEIAKAAGVLASDDLLRRRRRIVRRRRHRANLVGESTQEPRRQR